MNDVKDSTLAEQLHVAFERLKAETDAERERTDPLHVGGASEPAPATFPTKTPAATAPEPAPAGERVGRHLFSILERRAERERNATQEDA